MWGNDGSLTNKWRELLNVSSRPEMEKADSFPEPKLSPQSKQEKVHHIP